MTFTKHSDKVGKHAMLSASTWRWINDTPDELIRRLALQYAPVIGTHLHGIACNHIKFSVKLNRYDRKNVLLELLAKGVPGMILDAIDFDRIFDNLMAYVNDCIGFKMSPEVVLMYSDTMWGTTDAIHFDERARFLRIHDYKSGFGSVYMEQLMIYEALFCLEYHVNPEDIDNELRIYQGCDILYHNPTPEDIRAYMDQIVMADRILQDLKQGA